MGREGLDLNTVMRTAKRDPSQTDTYYVLGGHDLIEFLQPHALGTAVPILQRWKLRHREIADKESPITCGMAGPVSVPFAPLITRYSLFSFSQLPATAQRTVGASPGPVKGAGKHPEVKLY